MWSVFFIFSIVGGFSCLLWLFIRDRRYRAKKTRDALGDELKAEIAHERSFFESHRERFNRALDKARKKGHRIKGA